MTKKAFAFKTASHIILFPIVVLFFMFCNNINAQDVPTSSYGHTMSLSSSNEIFLYGGWEDGSALPKTNSREGVLGDIFKWDAASSQWTKLTTTNPPQDRVSHAAFFSSASGDDKLYVLYGTDYSAQFTDVWSFNPATNAWTEETITGTSPGSREVLACAATSDGKIIMVGALNSNYDTVNDVWAYDPASNTFEQKNSFPGGSTYANSMASCNGNVYSYGGSVGNSYTDKLWKYNSTTDSWTDVTNSALAKTNDGPPAARGFAAMTGYGNKLWIAGGQTHSGTSFADVWEFDVTTNTWTEVGTLTTARCEHAMAPIVANDGTVDLLIVNGRDGNTAIVDQEVVEDLDSGQGQANQLPVLGELPETVTLDYEGNTTINLTATDTETAADELVFSAESSSESVTVSIDEGNVLTITALTGFDGEVTITVTVEDEAGATDSFDITVTVNPDPTGIDNSSLPTEFGLDQNYPNPFNPSTTIKYSVAERTSIRLKVYDILGNEVKTLVSAVQPVGHYEINFTAGDIPSGVYFYYLKTENYYEIKKMILLK